MNFPAGISFVVPSYNEAKGIRQTVEELCGVLQSSGRDWEVLVVDDGSTDATRESLYGLPNVSMVRHPINIGYGNALKSGILKARCAWIGIVDADGSYPVQEIPRLLEALDEGFDMAIAARANTAEKDSFPKRLARRIYQGIVNLLSGERILDPNSGLRIFRRDVAMEFFPFLCGRFSFTTSLSILAVMKPFFVKYLPVLYQNRVGKSHVRHFRDSLVTLQMIAQGVCYYSPVKFFFFYMLLAIIAIGVPAMFLAMLGMSTLSLYFLLFCCSMSLLLAIGFLADIVRISAERSWLYKPEFLERSLRVISSGGNDAAKGKN